MVREEKKSEQEQVLSLYYIPVEYKTLFSQDYCMCQGNLSHKNNRDVERKTSLEVLGTRLNE